MAKKPVRKVTQAEVKHAESLYCEKKWTPEAIAETLERDIKTIYAWRDKYKWDDSRELFDTGPTELKRILLASAIRIARGEPRTGDDGEPLPEVDADAISKIMKAYDYMCRQASPSVCRDVLVELDNYISMHDPKAAIEATGWHKQFLIFKIEQNGN